MDMIMEVMVDTEDMEAMEGMAATEGTVAGMAATAAMVMVAMEVTTAMEDMERDMEDTAAMVGTDIMASKCLCLISFDLFCC